MPLPDLLCIGAQKSGTTWLDQVLRSHPDIGMAVTDKELHFFDRHYDKGLEWYEAQFPAPKKNNHGNPVIGEVTPAYLYFSQVPQRIYDCLGANIKFIVILRNPVDRVYSQYKTAVVDHGYSADFADFIKHADNAFNRGLYSEQIARYYQIFPPENFVFLIYERLFQDKEAELQRLAAHLNIAPQSFDRAPGAGRRYGAFQAVPRFHKSYRAAKWAQTALRKRGIHTPIRIAKRLGVHKGLFGKAFRFPPVPEAQRAELMARYADDIVKAEELTGLDLRAWWGLLSKNQK